MTLSDKYREALGFAFELHRNQERKGSGIPYVAHILGVSSLALENGADEESAIAALLHDAAEDQGGLEILQEIEKRFGKNVASIVKECTDSIEEPKPPWKDRKILYLEHLGSASTEAQLIASCDKLYNLRIITADYEGIGDSLWKRFSGGQEGVLWYYRSLAAALKMPVALKQEFDSTLNKLERLIAKVQNTPSQ